MPITRADPRPRSIWTCAEERRAICEHTVPLVAADRLWRLIRACVERGGLAEPEGLVFGYLEQCRFAMRNPTAPVLLSARQAARFANDLPPHPLRPRLVAALLSVVFDTWNTHRYPCFTPDARCYLAPDIKWRNTTDIMTTRRQLTDWAHRRGGSAATQTAVYLRRA